MRLPSARPSRESGSVMLLVTLLLPVLVIPMAGLAIDASVARLVQIRLQAAVDGAALGAGRLLGTPAVPQTIAAEFLAANFRTDNSAGTWGAYGLTCNVAFTPGITQRIDIYATAQVPLLFLRVIGYTNATVTATGSATHTNSRVMLVIDRSTSMSNAVTLPDGSNSTVIAEAKKYAQAFTKKFTESADELGLVVFDGSAFVAYPALNPAWDPTTKSTSNGGPNSLFQDPANPNNMLHQIGSITAAGQTGTAEALWLAYIELQKAHLKDKAALGVDLRVNSIVILTDGVPQSVTVWPNNPADNSIVGSPCANRITPGNPTPTPILGWIAANRPFNSGGPLGLYQLASRDILASHTSVWWVGNPQQDEENLNPQTATGCKGLESQPNGVTANNDFSKIPSIDMWGNSMACPGGVCAYTTASDMVDANGSSVTNPLAIGTPLDATQVSSGVHWALAFWNATDDAARRIRADVNMPNRIPADTQDMKIGIYVIGYSGNAPGNDQGLLKRVANDMACPTYDSTKPKGLFLRAGNPSTLADSFNTIYNALLRLAN